MGDKDETENTKNADDEGLADENCYPPKSGTLWIHKDYGKIKVTSDVDDMGRIGYNIMGSHAGGIMGENHWKQLIPSG